MADMHSLLEDRETGPAVLIQSDYFSIYNSVIAEGLAKVVQLRISESNID
jgi:hypothetical protein